MKKNITSQRGFTLIELLVVIAIIGILSAVVLASLSTARSKGADAAVKSDLASVRAETEVYYDSAVPNSYGPAFALAACPSVTGSMFFDDTQIQSALSGAATAAGQADLSNTRCATDGNAYAVAVPLKTAGFWCIDSSGIAKEYTADAEPVDGSTYTCK